VRARPYAAGRSRRVFGDRRRRDVQRESGARQHCAAAVGVAQRRRLGVGVALVGRRRAGRGARRRRGVARPAGGLKHQVQQGPRRLGDREAGELRALQLQLSIGPGHGAAAGVWAVGVVSPLSLPVPARQSPGSPWLAGPQDKGKTVRACAHPPPNTHTHTCDAHSRSRAHQSSRP
jgi:hypothetical protein